MTQQETLEQRITQLSVQIAAWRQRLPEANYHERAKLYVLIDLYEAMLARTQYAYRRALRGEQQLCERCHRPISRERLEAIPEATLCSHCAREVEHHDHPPIIQLLPSASSNVISILP